ncbi:uncharacterized protein LOC118460061 [Anopheles albimanus]|uniref:uncharacterized protein LOC118460061 n=1 Tax=Anopheles albimanus TaxID=7167 RepID=UPI00163E7EC1|nr:uncharacterized protein LOC118460061 [Anopheles albimanus]
MGAIAWWIAILLAAFGRVEADSSRMKDVLQYVGNLTHFQKAHHFGTFVCWLMQISEAPDPKLLSQSLAQKLSNSHEVVLIQADMRTSYSSAYPTPNIVIMFADRLEDNVNISVLYSWLSGIPSECLVVLVFRLTNEAIPESVANGWSSYNLLNVVMIALNEDVMFSFMYMPLRMIRHTGYPRFDDLLYDRVSTIVEAEVKAVYVNDVFTMQLGDIVGEDSRLFQLFFERLGIRFSSQKLSCKPLEMHIACIVRQKGSFLVLNRLTLTRYNKRFVDTIEMEKYVILAPRGRLLSFAEIWLKPFDWSVWIVLAIICFVSYLLNCIAPKTIGNNLFLLALIGLEKRKLRLSGRLEKFMAAGLLVLFYQMKCAYETKLIAYMIDHPSEPNPRTIDDLRRRNIPTILDNISINQSIMQTKYDMRLEKRYGNATLDKKNIAYIVNAALSEIVNVDRLNLDPKSGKPQFVFLKDSIFTDMSFFSFNAAPVIKAKFASFQRIVFEVGLKQHWRLAAIRYVKKYQLSLYDNSRDRLPTVVKSEKLWLIFRIVVIMWFIAGVVFLFEIGFVQARKRWLSMRKHKKKGSGRPVRGYW